jgi:hypothetical protein
MSIIRWEVVEGNDTIERRRVSAGEDKEGLMERCSKLQYIHIILDAHSKALGYRNAQRKQANGQFGSKENGWGNSMSMEWRD